LPLSAVAEAVGLKVVEHVRRTFPRVRPAALRERGALASSARRPLFPVDPPSLRTSVPRRASRRALHAGRRATTQEQRPDRFGAPCDPALPPASHSSTVDRPPSSCNASERYSLA